MKFYLFFSRLSPEVVASCQEDIKTLCRSKEIGGKTLHCLMKNIRKHNTVSDACVRSLEDLLRTTDPGSDWQVDGLLKDACQPVVDSLCKNRDNPAGTLPCLMEKYTSTLRLKSFKDNINFIRNAK